MIRVKRAYDPAEPDDGERYLVDRLWPRGMRREDLRIHGWLREVAPSAALRRWFGHDPAKWEEFKRRYFAELESRPETWRPVVEAARRGNVTLLYSARDPLHNNAVALQGFLEHRQKNSPGDSRS
ncbi:MAG: DUF488 family protein [Armatimonadetes bacterium]|nr:DUF488 family protein [Armatimonadota bacterium]MDW8154922.1 DUF488 family protein [Armatimonadota bacterium]